MTASIHIVRKDLRRLRPLLGLWILVLGTVVALSLSSSPTAVESVRTDLLLQRLSELMTIAELLLGGLIIALVVHEEPLVGSSAFWLTRPYHRGALLRAKLLFVFAVLIVLPLLGDITIMTTMGAGAPALASAIPALALGYLVATLSMLVVAVLTPSLASFVLTLVGIVTGVTLLTTVTSALSSYFYSAPTYRPYDPPGAPDFTPAIVALVAYVCAALSVVVYQYRHRRLRPAILLAVAGAAATIILPMVWPFPLARGEETHPGPWSERIAASYDASWGTETSEPTRTGRGEPQRHVIARVTWSGAPPEIIVQQIGVRGTLRLPDGATIRSGQRTWLGSSVRAAPVEAALGGVRLLQTGEVIDQELMPTPLVTLTEEEFGRYRRSSGRLEADLFFELIRTHETAALPLKNGAAIDRPLERMEITDVRRRTGSRDVTIRQWVAGSWLPPLNRRRLFVLRHRGRGEALMGAEATNGARGVRSSAGMVLLLGLGADLRAGVLSAGFAFRTMIVRFPGPESGNAPALDAAWFDEAELVVLETDWAGVVSRPLTIDPFPIPAN